MSSIFRLSRNTLFSAALPILAGLIFALLILVLGPITLPGILVALFILPWLLKDIYRLFILLIITWPILTLYFRIPLPAGIPDLTYERLCILLLLCVFIIEALLSKRRLLKGTALDMLVLVYMAAQLSSRLFVFWFGGAGEPDLNGLLDILFIPLILYWMAKNLLISRKHLQWFLYALVAASFLICLTGLYEQVVGVKVFQASTSLGGSGEEKIWNDVPRGRATGAVENPAIFGAIMGIGSLAGICGLAHIKHKLAWVVLMVATAVLLYGIFASYTRSAWLSGFLVLFFAQFFINDNNLWKKTLPIFMIGLLLLVFLWNMLSADTAFMNRVMNTSNIVQRLDINKLGWKLFLEKPFLGWGSGALSTFSAVQVGETSHNIYFSFLVDGGLLLFLSFSATFGYLIIRAFRVYERTEKGSLERNVLIAATGSVLIFLLSGFFLELRYFSYFNALFMINVGVIDSLGVRCG